MIDKGMIGLIILSGLHVFVSGIVIPDNANVDCYYDAFNEANITSLLIGERGHSSNNRFSFMGNIKMNGNDICLATILNREHILTESDCCQNIIQTQIDQPWRKFEFSARDGRFRYDITDENIFVQEG